MTSNPTTYKRQVTFNRGLINFPDFTKFLPKAPPLHFFNFPDAEGDGVKKHAKKEIHGASTGQAGPSDSQFFTFLGQFRWWPRASISVMMLL